MRTTHRLAPVIGMIISFLSVSASAQTAGSELNHFAADGISFDYPAEFSIKDQSTTEAQQLIITRKGSSVQLAIVAIRQMILRDQLSAAIEQFRESAVKKVAITLGQGNPSPDSTSFQTQVGTRQAEGVRLQSTASKRTGEVIWLRLGFRLIGFLYVKSDADQAVGSQLWQTVSSSLRVEAPVVAAMAVTEPTKNTKIEDGVLNGKALALGRPAYPPIARAAHASGTVKVQVLIDEEGNVIAAHAVAGHPLLQSVSVGAARQSKFPPTLLEGEPVKLAGVLMFKFIVRFQSW